MRTNVKTEEQISSMREGGKLLATVLNSLKQRVRAGISEKELDIWVENEIRQLGAFPTYHTPDINFPGSICISVNNKIVHGVPTDYILEKGDVVSFDLVITYKGMMTDAAFTMVVDQEPAGAVKNLLHTTERSLYAGIDAIRGGGTRTGDIGEAIEKMLTQNGLTVVRDLVGHGVGLGMHEPPEMPNFGRKGTGILLQPGDTVAIEPMATLGKGRIRTEDDGWTIVTADGSLAAHYEHTILITQSGAEILTQV